MIEFQCPPRCGTVLGFTADPGDGKGCGGETDGSVVDLDSKLEHVDECQRGGRNSKRKRRLARTQPFENVVDIEFELAIPPVWPSADSQRVNVIVVPRHLVEVRLIPSLFERHSHGPLSPT